KGGSDKRSGGGLEQDVGQVAEHVEGHAASSRVRETLRGKRMRSRYRDAGIPVWRVGVGGDFGSRVEGEGAAGGGPRVRCPRHRRPPQRRDVSAAASAGGGGRGHRTASSRNARVEQRL